MHLSNKAMSYSIKKIQKFLLKYEEEVEEKASASKIIPVEQSPMDLTYDDITSEEDELMCLETQDSVFDILLSPDESDICI